MNFIFISPQFPKHYWNFCDRLKKNGVNVLGIGDSPYDALSDELKNALTEYYYLPHLDDYEQMVRAVGFFTFKYGKIDWIESNNEFWLEQDARLRTDFHVTTGEQYDHIDRIKNKSAMKAYYAKAGVPTARLHKVTTFEAGRDFAHMVGYPVIVKPDNGVGACDTYKLHSDDELAYFYATKPQSVPYVMEEFINGQIFSYDAILDSHSEPLFESTTAWPPSIMDIVLKQLDLAYYTAADVPEALRRAGRATVKAFGVRSRFVHLEFFCLAEDKEGLGKKGDFVGLEVNMRPAGGYTPDMMNYANSADCYQIWADMVCYDEVRNLELDGPKYYCVYAGRRDCHTYKHSNEQIMARYGNRMKMHERIPQALRLDMGDEMYTVTVRSSAERDAFIRYVQEKA